MARYTDCIIVCVPGNPEDAVLLVVAAPSEHNHIAIPIMRTTDTALLPTQ